MYSCIKDVMQMIQSSVKHVYSMVGSVLLTMYVYYIKTQHLIQLNNRQQKKEGHQKGK
jgi:hypothetical protein